MNNEKIIILGAGLAGSLIATMLRREGFSVEVFEKRSDPRITNRAEGKSINLALSHRGIHALKQYNLYDSVKEKIIPMRGRMVHTDQVKVQLYGKSGQEINSISRLNLNQCLIEAAEESGVIFNFSAKVSEVSIENTSICYSKDGKTFTTKGTIILGTDGAYSILRQEMIKNSRFNFTQFYIEHGYKELTLPAKHQNFVLDPHYLHIWPRGNFMLIALPNPDHSFTCTLFFPFTGDPSFSSLRTSEQIYDFFSTYFPDILDTVPDVVSQFQKNPTSSLVTIRSSPWYLSNCLLLGDAAHAIVPFFGQGMNAAFEDCRIFMEIARKNKYQWPSVFEDFYNSRKKDTDAISEMALRNFHEMRDQVMDEDFMERRRADAWLHALFPDEWIPMYTMVTFTDLPYSYAKSRGEIQERVLIQAQEKHLLDDPAAVMEILRDQLLKSSAVNH